MTRSAPASSTSLVVPRLEAEPWPSLGGQVCDFIEDLLVHGPGDVLGQAARLTEDFQRWIWRAYEVYPRGHALEGRRRFKRAALSRPKGVAKTELLAWVGIAELDPDGPVRFGGWDARGEPVGVPVRDPYIPLVATSELQSDELAFGAAYSILEHCDLGNNYDLGLERISHRSAAGKMASLSSAPSSREGARTTFQGFDEPHLFLSPRLKGAHATMLRNIPKRKAADAWSMYTTTMYEPGAGSVAQELHELALDIAAGRVDNPRLFFDHRQASHHWDLSRKRDFMHALEEAYGEAAAWTDLSAIASSFFEPGADRQAVCRFFLNQRVKGSGRWLAPELYEPLSAPRRRPRPGVQVVLAFDGSESRDSTALVGCTIAERPHVWVEAVWEKPLSSRGQWNVSRLDVEAAIEHAMERYDVRELAPDPPRWHKEIEEWEQRWGDLVVRFDTNQPSRMGPAADLFEQAVKDASFTHDGTEQMLRHLGNCMTRQRGPWKLPVKSHTDSPDKIDVAVAAVIALSRAVWHHAHPPAVFRWGPA